MQDLDQFKGSTFIEELKIENCDPLYPYFSQYDIIVNDDNFEDKIIENENLFLIATHKSCLSCCKHEKIKGIKLGRIEMSQNKQFLQKFQEIKRFPFIFYFKNQEKFVFKEILSLQNIVNFVNKSQLDQSQLVQKLKKVEELENLLNNYQKVNFNQILVIGLFDDKKENQQEIKQFQRASDFLQNRPDIHFYIMTGKKLIQEVKQKFIDFFEDYSSASVIIARTFKQYQIIDIADIVTKMQNLSQVVEYNALKLVDEFTYQNYKFYQEKKKPILVAIVDSIVETEKTEKFIYLLEQLAIKYIDKIYITWVESALNPEKRNLLGIKQNQKTPSLGFFRIDYETKIVFPEFLNIFDFQNLDSFVHDYLNKPLEFLKEKYSNLDQKKKFKEINTEKFKFVPDSNSQIYQVIKELNLEELENYLKKNFQQNQKINNKNNKKQKQPKIRPDSYYSLVLISNYSRQITDTKYIDAFKQSILRLLQLNYNREFFQHFYLDINEPKKLEKLNYILQNKYKNNNNDYKSEVGSQKKAINLSLLSNQDVQKSPFSSRARFQGVTTISPKSTKNDYNVQKINLTCQTPQNPNFIQPTKINFPGKDSKNQQKIHQNSKHMSSKSSINLLNDTNMSIQQYKDQNLTQKQINYLNSRKQSPKKPGLSIQTNDQTIQNPIIRIKQKNLSTVTHLNFKQQDINSNQKLENNKNNNRLNNLNIQPNTNLQRNKSHISFTYHHKAPSQQLSASPKPITKILYQYSVTPQKQQNQVLQYNQQNQQLQQIQNQNINASNLQNPVFDQNKQEKYQQIYIPVSHIKAESLTERQNNFDSQFLSTKNIQSQEKFNQQIFNSNNSYQKNYEIPQKPKLLQQYQQNSSKSPSYQAQTSIYSANTIQSPKINIDDKYLKQEADKLVSKYLINNQKIEQKNEPNKEQQKEKQKQNNLLIPSQNQNCEEIKISQKQQEKLQSLTRQVSPSKNFENYSSTIYYQKKDNYENRNNSIKQFQNSKDKENSANKNQNITNQSQYESQIIESDQKVYDKKLYNQKYHNRASLSVSPFKNQIQQQSLEQKVYDKNLNQQIQNYNQTNIAYDKNVNKNIDQNKNQEQNTNINNNYNQNFQQNLYQDNNNQSNSKKEIQNQKEEIQSNSLQKSNQQKPVTFKIHRNSQSNEKLNEENKNSKDNQNKSEIQNDISSQSPVRINRFDNINRKSSAEIRFSFNSMSKSNQNQINEQINEQKNNYVDEIANNKNENQQQKQKSIVEISFNQNFQNQNQNVLSSSNSYIQSEQEFQSSCQQTSENIEKKSPSFQDTENLQNGVKIENHSNLNKQNQDIQENLLINNIQTQNLFKKKDSNNQNSISSPAFSENKNNQIENNDFGQNSFKYQNDKIQKNLEKYQQYIIKDINDQIEFKKYESSKIKENNQPDKIQHIEEVDNEISQKKIDKSLQQNSDKNNLTIQNQYAQNQNIISEKLSQDQQDYKQSKNKNCNFQLQMNIILIFFLNYITYTLVEKQVNDQKQEEISFYEQYLAQKKLNEEKEQEKQEQFIQSSKKQQDSDLYNLTLNLEKKYNLVNEGSYQNLKDKSQNITGQKDQNNPQKINYNSNLTQLSNISDNKDDLQNHDNNLTLKNDKTLLLQQNQTQLQNKSEKINYNIYSNYQKSENSDKNDKNSNEVFNTIKTIQKSSSQTYNSQIQNQDQKLYKINSHENLQNEQFDLQNKNQIIQQQQNNQQKAQQESENVDTDQQYQEKGSKQNLIQNNNQNLTQNQEQFLQQSLQSQDINQEKDKISEKSNDNQQQKNREKFKLNLSNAKHKLSQYEEQELREKLQKLKEEQEKEKLILLEKQKQELEKLQIQYQLQEIEIINSQRSDQSSLLSSKQQVQINQNNDGIFKDQYKKLELQQQKSLENLNKIHIQRSLQYQLNHQQKLNEDEMIEQLYSNKKEQLSVLKDKDSFDQQDNLGQEKLNKGEILNSHSQFQKQLKVQFSQEKNDQNSSQKYVEKINNLKENSDEKQSYQNLDITQKYNKFLKDMSKNLSQKTKDLSSSIDKKDLSVYQIKKQFLQPKVSPAQSPQKQFQKSLEKSQQKSLSLNNSGEKNSANQQQNLNQQQFSSLKHSQIHQNSEYTQQNNQDQFQNQQQEKLEYIKLFKQFQQENIIQGQENIQQSKHVQFKQNKQLSLSNSSEQFDTKNNSFIKKNQTTTNKQISSNQQENYRNDKFKKQQQDNKSLQKSKTPKKSSQINTNQQNEDTKAQIQNKDQPKKLFYKSQSKKQSFKSTNVSRNITPQKVNYVQQNKYQNTKKVVQRQRIPQNYQIPQKLNQNSVQTKNNDKSKTPVKQTHNPVQEYQFDDEDQDQDQQYEQKQLVQEENTDDVEQKQDDSQIFINQQDYDVQDNILHQFKNSNKNQQQEQQNEENQNQQEEEECSEDEIVDSYQNQFSKYSNNNYSSQFKDNLHQFQSPNKNNKIIDNSENVTLNDMMNYSIFMKQNNNRLIQEMNKQNSTINNTLKLYVNTSDINNTQEHSKVNNFIASPQSQDFKIYESINKSLIQNNAQNDKFLQKNDVDQKNINNKNQKQNINTSSNIISQKNNKQQLQQKKISQKGQMQQNQRESSQNYYQKLAYPLKESNLQKLKELQAQNQSQISQKDQESFQDQKNNNQQKMQQKSNLQTSFQKSIMQQQETLKKLMDDKYRKNQNLYQNQKNNDEQNQNQQQQVKQQHHTNFKRENSEKNQFQKMRKEIKQTKRNSLTQQEKIQKLNSQLNKLPDILCGNNNFV
ncbi:Thioredoxin-like fold [Pseudocohnilembus persalinus]|uniref:Thioredoxin-like fold n=1 Tax=Pseudocohnilembus persalinus TaxID=266149 RepID=A0A0V0R9D7_PSEPJ|nr:Thioredoxin-like fold [Pseudocohnilembus persalinus]|eukprot:KRX11070.1 Thioredoxin-like fold [Pseudocohnilembus persalinus]